MTRILFVSTSTTIGGAEKMLFQLATGLDRERFDVRRVISLKPLGEYARRLGEKGVRVESLGMSGRLPGPAQLSRLVEIVEREKPDLVHAFLYTAIQLCRVAKRRTRHAFPLVTAPRMNQRTRSGASLLVDRLLKGVDALTIAECEATRRHLLDHQGYPAEKVTTIRNGIDLAAEPSATERAAKRRELGLTDGDLLLGTVGRLDEQKDQETLLEAVAILARSRPVRCVLVGDGPRRARLETRARELGLAGTVVFAGEQLAVSPWLSSLDVFVLSSRWEGFPNAILEAMLHALPVVATAVDGVPEVVEEGRTGLLVPPGDSEALARRLEELVADPARRRRFGEAGRAIVVERFSRERMLAAYEATYVAVVTGRARA